MTELKNLKSLAEVEFCLGRYLDSNVTEVMESVREELTRRQLKERTEYQSSLRGALANFANSMNPSLTDTTDQHLRATGEWNSKTTDDYLAMCQERLLKNKEVTRDMAALTAEYRTAMVKEVGRKSYDEASRKLGTDLARAYIDYRLQQTMVNVLVNEHTPRTTAEYVMRRGAEGSLIGFASSLNRSGLDAQIAREAEARYKANGYEWAAAKATSIAIDSATTLGCGSWANLAKFAGADVIFSGIEVVADKKRSANQVSIEECISQGVFGAQKGENLFTVIRQQSNWLDGERNKGVSRINSSLKRPVQISSVNGTIARGFQAVVTPLAQIPNFVKQSIERAGKEERGEREEREKEERGKESAESGSTPPLDPDEQLRREQAANQEGWAELMSDLGYSGMGDIKNNLGYVIAMLPDILIGTLTGKTHSLHIRHNMVPMASILAGMFVKNPLLKTLLIGMGGMNLLNKAGHESLERHANPDGLRFKQYPAEELNPRITSPAVNGNCLVANIDRMPCSVTLPENVMAAYESGALPLSTLANAVLAKHDAGSQLAQSNYRSAVQDNNLQNNRLR